MPATIEPPASANVEVTPEFAASFDAAFAADEATRKPPVPAPPAAPAAPAQPAAQLPAQPPAPVAEEPVPEHIKSSKAAEDWKLMRRRVKELEPYAERTKLLEEELAKVKTAPPPTDEFKTKYEETAKQRDEYQKLVRAADLANDPEFKGYFETKTKTLVGMAKGVASTEQQAVIDKWLTRPESDARTAALEEVVNEVGMLRGQKLAAIINDIDRLHIERETELTKARENWDQLMEKRGKLTQAQQERSKADADDAFSRAVKAAQNKEDKEMGSMLYQEVEGNSEWNRGVKERQELARKIFNGEFSVEGRAKAALWAAETSGARGIVESLSQQNAALKAELAQIKAGSPSPGATEAGGGIDTNEDKDLSEAGIMRRAAKIDFSR